MKSKRAKRHFSGSNTGKAVRIGIFVCVLLLTNVLRLPFLLSNRPDVTAATNQSQVASASADAANPSPFKLDTRDEVALVSNIIASGKSTLFEASELTIATQSASEDALLDQLVKSAISSDAEDDLEQANEADTDGEKKPDSSENVPANGLKDGERDEFDDAEDAPVDPLVKDAESSDAEDELEQADEAEVGGKKKTGRSEIALANPLNARELDEFDDEDYDGVRRNPFFLFPVGLGNGMAFDALRYYGGGGGGFGGGGGGGGSGGSGGGSGGGGSGGPPVISP